MSNGTHTIEGRTYTVSVNIDRETIFETTTSVYREVTITGVRGAYYTSERKLGSNILVFWKETEGRRSRLPSPAFDGMAFVLEGNELRPATYPEVKAGREAATAYRNL